MENKMKTREEQAQKKKCKRKDRDCCLDNCDCGVTFAIANTIFGVVYE
jgi:hypothetical protein